MITYAKKTTPSDPFQVFHTQRRPMIVTFCCVMLVAIAMVSLGQKMYQSEAKFFVRLGHESVSLDPTATTGHVVTVQESRENEINSILELLRSRVILENVVTAVGPEIVLGREANNDSEGQQVAGVFSTLNVFAPYSLDDEALKTLFNNLRIVAGKKSNIISVVYEANSPTLARDIVAKVIEEAREAHMRVNRTTGSQEFFATQAGQLHDKLVRLESELRDLKNTSGIASLLVQRDLKLGQVSDLESSLLKAESNLSASASEMNTHQTTLKTIPETITTDETTGMPQSKIASMRQQLFLLQVQQQEILSKYQPSHPLALAVSGQVAAIKSVLNQEPPESQVSQGRNSTHAEIHLAYLKTDSTVASLRAEASTLREQLAPARQELTNFNNQEVEIARLEREIALETANYKKYSEALEQARIDHELQIQNISNLNILQPPSYSITPSRPRPLFNLGVGLLAAIASSVVVGVLLDQRRSRLAWASRPMLPAVDSSMHVANGRFEKATVQQPWDSAPTGGNGVHHETTS